MPVTAAPADLRAELDRQVAVLVDKGVPALAGLSRAAFLEQVEPLADRLPRAAGEGLPFVVVPGRALVPPHALVPLLELRGRQGCTTMPPEDVASFMPRPDVEVPAAAVYLLLDVDLGAATLDVPPEQALPGIVAAGRSPLLLEEGLAVVQQHPELLRTASCFSMLGSRCGDRRVPAVWVKRGGAPRLGWCWDGAPHTWLGSASCAGRAA